MIKKKTYIRVNISKMFCILELFSIKSVTYKRVLTLNYRN